jgi:YD repeat-containing protein
MCLAQTSAPPVDLISVKTVSPEAASIGKFGNIPVSMATGVSEISIPIYTIEIAGIVLPVSLNYHSSGIRVDEVSSSVGIGWALTGTGMISRNLIGLPDETPTNGYISAPAATDVAMAGSGSSTYRQYLFNVHSNLADAEPDVFQYSFLGQAGKFIFRHDGSVMQIPASNNIIQFTGGNFVITDVNGIKYIFDQKQSASSTQDNLAYTSEWMLTKLIAANSIDTVFFTYETACNTSYSQIVNGTFTIGMTDGSCGMQDAGGNSYATFSASLGTQAKDYYQTITHNESYIKEIKWRGGKLSFTNICDRQDVRGSGERLSEIGMFAEKNGVYTQTKRWKMNQSYFFSNPYSTTVSDEKLYRLRLDSVSMLSVGSAVQPSVYRMEYDTGMMAPRESFATDRWGYNNGKFSQRGTMAMQSTIYNMNYYSFGSANRETDSSAILACTLKKIQYPTKGTSVFDYEPHRYKTNLTSKSPQSASCFVTGGVQVSNTTTFSVSTNATYFTCTPYISKTNTSQGFTDRPRIIIKDVATGDTVFSRIETPASLGNEGIAYNPGIIAITLQPSHTYKIDINIYTTNSSVNANITLNWIDTTSAIPDVKKGGGLRVKKITNYDLNGRFLNRQTYEYGDSGIGVILTPQYYQDINFEKVVSRVGCTGGTLNGTCVDFYEEDPSINPIGYSYIFHSNSIYPTTQYTGSPVLYRKVTKYEVDSVGIPNGKRVLYYDIYQDGSTISNNGVSDPLPSEYFVNGIYLISNNWKNGYQTGEDIYKYISGNYILQSRKRISYRIAKADQEFVLKIKPRYRSSGCESVLSYEASCYAVPITSGVMLPTIVSDSIFDDAGNFFSKIEAMDFNSNLLINSRQRVESNGDTLLETVQYPSELAVSGNVFQKMVTRNILSPKIKEQKLVNGNNVTTITRNYVDYFGDSKLFLPLNTEVKIGSYSSEVRARFNYFDQFGNIAQQQKDSDVFNSVIWDYRSTLPIAKVSNAALADIAYTSFEADGNGSWTGIIPANISSGSGVTGINTYSLTTAGLTKTALTSSLSYVVSYWSKNGPYTVAGTSPILTGRSVVRAGNSWTYYEHLVTGVTSIKVAGTGAIDELRLFPSTAQMETFCYAPGIGIISKTDSKGLTAYYEYDGLGRLQVVRDQDNNILQTLDYNFKQ